MTDTLTLTGLVATEPQVVRPRPDLEIATFRLASNQRHFDRKSGSWIDRETNWYTISSYRTLAQNVVSSLHKGDRVVVSGRLKIRSWEKNDRRGISVEVDADAIGADLAWGTVTFVRNPRSSSDGAEGAATAEESNGSRWSLPGEFSPPREHSPDVVSTSQRFGTDQSVETAQSFEPSVNADNTPF